MTKPWTQEWKQNSLESRTVETADGWRVAEAYPASEHGGYANTTEVAKFIAAAPDMARALLRRIGDPTLAPCLCHLTAPDTCANCEDRQMLRDAGVLE